jgi:hypothetical protein
MITSFMANNRNTKRQTATSHALHKAVDSWNKAKHTLDKAQERYQKAQKNYKKAHGLKS